MPVWNPRSEWLHEAIASALGQRGCSVELIVVDDGCVMPVSDLLGDIDDGRLRLLRVSHGRVSRARNAGIAVARGEYYRFIDCDDVIVEDSTAHLLSLANGDRVVTYGATMVCNERLKPYSMIASSLQGHVAEPCLLNRVETTIHSLLFPARVVEAIGEWEPSIVVSQDWDYALRAFEHAPVRGDKRVATYYRMHSQMNSRNVAEGIRGYQLVVQRYFERHPEQRGGSLNRRAEALFHVFAAIQLMRLRRLGEAARHLWGAVKLDPAATLGGLSRQGAIPLTPALARIRWLRERSRMRHHARG